jgi:hypothetical protein
MKYVIEPGEWEIIVGASSEDIIVRTILNYKGK